MLLGGAYRSSVAGTVSEELLEPAGDHARFGVAARRDRGGDVLVHGVHAVNNWQSSSLFELRSSRWF